MFIPDPDLDYLPIPDPGVKKAQDPGSASKNFYVGIYFKPKKMFPSSGYDLGCSSRIRILIIYPSRIPGSKRHRNPDPDP
jgi:hypothetical protein